MVSGAGSGSIPGAVAHALDQVKRRHVREPSAPIPSCPSPSYLPPSPSPSQGLEVKLDVLQQTGALSHGLWDTLVFKKVQKGLGLDRCEKVVCGSAPISAFSAA